MSKRPDCPNILLIIADQHRQDCVGYVRSEMHARTPHIDSLASRGWIFDHCITPAPICCPARTALASGQRPGRLGVLDNDRYLPLSTVTLYQRIRDHGYWTGLVGKLDIEKGQYPGRDIGPDSRIPVMMSYGFCDHRHASADMWIPDSPQMPFHYYLAERGLFETFRDDRRRRAEGRWCVRVNFDSPLPVEHHVERYAANHAIDFIENAPEGHPWFLQLSFDGPHDPFDPPTAFAERFRDIGVPDPIPADYTGKPRWVADRKWTDDADDIAIARRQYLASIEQIDTEIGRVLECLRRSGQTEDTIVVYTSDHGEMLGDFGLYQKEVPYESAIRVPLVIAGPGIATGVNSSLVDWMDLNPTLCEMAGLPPQENIDARSLRPIIGDPDAVNRESVIVSLSNFRALRTDRFLYVESFNDIPELYDLLVDPEQKNNLLAEAGRGERETADLLSEQLLAEEQQDRWLR